MVNAQLSVGDRVRDQAGHAILSSLALAAAFATFTVATKETPALYLHQPWQDDPYDALISFDFVALPLLVIIGALRLPLCRRHEALPVRRVEDLLRVCRVAIALVLGTQVAEWIAVVRGTHAAQWNAASAGQLAVLATLTATSIAAGVLLRSARRELARANRAAAQPDWFADAVALGLREAPRLGPLRGLAEVAVRWVDQQLITRVRAHPIAAAMLVALVLTLPELTAKIVLEGYPIALVLVVFGVSVASLFAFLVLVGSYLRVVAPLRSSPSAWLCATVAACVAAPLAGAFRDSLLGTVGADQSHPRVRQLAVLMVAAGAVVGALSLAVQSALRHIRRDWR
jgi:hypothetical protein